MTQVPLLTIADVAEHLRVHPRTVRRAIRDGRLRAIEVAGRTWRIHPDDLDAFLEQRATPTAPAPTDVHPLPLGAIATAGRARHLRRRATGHVAVTADMGRGS